MIQNPCKRERSWKARDLGIQEVAVYQSCASEATRFSSLSTNLTAVGLQYCNKLFAEERKCVLYKQEYRKEYRQNRELSLLGEYFT